MEDSTPEITYCARHPKVETGLRCASCGTPICPKCMVTAPVGMKCPDCGRGRNIALFQIRPERLLLAGVTALAAGAVATLIGKLGFFVIFLSLPYGYFAGNVILKASGMKRGLKLEIITGTTMILGALGSMLFPPFLVSMSLGDKAPDLATLALPYLVDIFTWVAVVISTGAAISKIRYL